MGVFFTSDWHLGHRNIIKYSSRPWNNVYEMDDAIIKTHNSLVKDKDLVYFLGDFTMNYCFVEKYLPNLHGRWVWILGNHDKIWWKKLVKNTNIMNRKVLTVHEILDIRIGRQPVTLCHYPMVSWNKSYHQSWHLFGHTHGKYNNTHSLSMDVGIDATNYVPLSEEVVVEKMQKRAHDIMSLR